MKDKKFSALRAIAHLLEQLGEEKFSTLIDSVNTGKIKEFCEKILIEGPLPSRMKLGKHTYTIYDPLLEDEKAENVRFSEMLRRVKGANEILTDRGAGRLLRDQKDIPIACRGDKVIFIFLLAESADNSSKFHCRCVFWDDTEKHWQSDSAWLSKWDRRYRVINKIWTCD